MLIKFFTQRLLKRANNLAIKRGYSKTLQRDLVGQIPKKLKLPIVCEVMRDENCCQVVIALGCGPGDVAMFDCDIELYGQLPTQEIEGE